MSASAPTVRRGRRWVRGLAIALGLVLLLVALVHTPPVRWIVLGRAVATVEGLGMVLEADALEYNLFTLRLTLRGVRLAAAGTPDAPFLQASQIDVALPASVLSGTFGLDLVRLLDARIVIARDQDGVTNLPTSGDNEASGEPAGVPIRRLEIPNLDIDISDAILDSAVSIPGISLDIGLSDGSLQLFAPGSVRRAAVTTELTRLGGGVAFDGRELRFTEFTLATTETTVTASGTLALFVTEPRVDLLLDGTVDLAALARWSASDTTARGDVTFQGAVAGRLTSPTLTADLRSDALAWDAVEASAIDGSLTVDATRLDVSQVNATMAGGRVGAMGDLSFESGAANLAASWSDVDLATLARQFAPLAAPQPTGRATGTMTMSGVTTQPAEWAVDAQVAFRTLAARRGQIALGGNASLQVADGQWRLRATPTLMDIPIDADLRGRLSSDRVAASTVGGTLAFADVDLRQLTSALRAAELLDAPDETVTAGRLDASATIAGTFEAPRLELTTAVRELAALGVSDLSADVTASGTLQRLTVEASLQQGNANALRAAGTVQPEAQRLDLRVDGRLTQLSALLPDVPFGGAVDLQFVTSGRFDALEGEGTVMVADARYGDLLIGRLAATVGLDPTRVRVDVVSDELGARASGLLTLGATQTATVDLNLEQTDLTRLVSQIETPVPLEGRVSLEAHASGPVENWREGTADIALSLLDSRVGDLPVTLAGPARVSYRDQTLEVTNLEARLGATQLSVVGRLPIAAGLPPVDAAETLRATLVGDIPQTLDAIRATGLVTLPEISGQGPLALLARVTGSAERPLLAADVELGPSVLTIGDLPPVTAVELRAYVEDGWVELRSATAQWEGSQLVAEGRLPLRLLDEYLPASVVAALPVTTGNAALTARATAITPRMLAGFVDAETLSQIDGELDATIVLDAASMRLEDLRGEARLDRFDARVTNLAIAQREPTRIVFEDGFARIAAWDWAGEGATLGVRGQVRLVDGQSAILADGQIDLRTVNPFVRSAGMTANGLLTPRISITGPLTDPRIDGDLTLARGNVRLAEPRVIVTDLTLRALLSRTRVLVTSVGGIVNGGTLAGSGEIDYSRQTPLSAQFVAALTAVGFEFPEGLRSELNADLTLSLADTPQGPGGRIAGTVTVARAAYREPIAVVTGLLTALRTRPLTTVASREDSVLDRLQLDVRVLTDSDLVVDNNIVQAELGGDLRVIGTASAPALSGRTTIREGGQLFLGRNAYTITSGTIDFTNPVTIEPTLNIQATTRAGGESIQLTISGTPDDPTVTLRSETTPELGQADLASLLLTGRRLDEVPGAEAQIVGEQVLGYLSGDILGAASRVVGLDTLRLGGVDQSDLRRDPAAVASATDPTSRLTFGKNLGEALELTFSQSLRDGDAQTWILDYRPISQVNLRLISRDDNLRSYEFRHDLSIGSGTARPASAPGTGTIPLRISDLALTGTLGAAESGLRDLLDLTPGDRFDFSDWQRDRDRLEQFLRRQGYREAYVAATRNEGPREVSLSYEIEAGPMTAISVNGYSLPGRVLDALDQAWSDSVLDAFLEEEADDIVRLALAEDGYLRPEILAVVIAGDTKTLRIDIAPGERALERMVTIDAEDAVLARGLEQWLRDERLDELAWREPRLVEQALTARLGSQGFLNASVTTTPVRAEGRTAVLAFAVTPGPTFTIKDVAFVGADSLDDTSLIDAANLQAGAPYDPIVVEAARSRVTRTIRDAGFAEAGVILAPSVDGDTRQVSLVFMIDAGRRQILREIAVQGNRSIDTSEITRTLAVTVGEPVGSSSWLPARARLFDTALFQRVDVAIEPLDDMPADIGERPMRMVVTVREWPAVRIRYGVGLSEERPDDQLQGRELVPGLSADITRRTLFGRAVTVGAAGTYQLRQRLGRLFVTAPTLFGLPIESISTIRRLREELAGGELLSASTGISWEQRLRVTNRLRLSYSYAFDRNHIFEVDPTPDPLSPSFDVTVNIARLSGGALYDSRDNPIDTQRGLLLSSNIEYAPESFGSGISFLRHLGQAYYFRPVRGMVAASAVRVGTITPLRGLGLIPSELFYTGGARSVRGVEQDGLGPRNVFDEPAGGGGLVVLNQELRFPLYRWVSGVGFVDAGNIFKTPSAIDFSALVASTGVGLRFTTPFAMLRVDYARLWSPRAGQASGQWTFGIGQAF